MPTYLELEVSLRWVKPKAWRRFLIRNDFSFDVLHHAIQDACGWWDSHLYGFFAYDRRGVDWDTQFARSPHEGGWGEPPRGRNAAKVKLPEVLAEKGDMCVYVYDYGDNWEHEVKVVAVHELDEVFKRRLLAGARAFPLEDCGSIPGYEELVACFQTPENKLDEDARYRLQWAREMDPTWRPDRFDMESEKKSFDKKR
ncbi:MAG: plasmid pRiA4b ORF-3 family protein [Planctomycetota bacterium]|nr:plasmid pRiA4b ORF-3 family protein [Planctomycetota bacterium]